MQGVFGVGVAGAAQEGFSPAERLPDEMIQHIASFLNPTDWATMFFVCGRWQFILLNVANPRTMLGLSEQSRCFQIITGKLTKMGDLKRALELAQMLSRVWQQADSFYAISKELANQGLYKEALDVANKISQLEESGWYCKEDIRNLRDLKASALELISQKIAQSDVDQALAVADQIEYRKNSTSRALTFVVSRLLKKDDIARAKTVAEQIPSKRLKPFPLQAIAKAEANLGSTAL